MRCFRVIFMHRISLLAVLVDAAVFMHFKAAFSCMNPAVHLISHDSHEDSYHKQNGKKHKSLVRNHGKHDECLVS
jgi:hypothetical protein